MMDALLYWSPDARVNIEAIQGITRSGEGLARFVPDSADRARRGLDAAAFRTRRAKSWS